MNAARFPAVAAARARGLVLADNAAGAQLPDLAIEAMRRYLEHDNAQQGVIFPRNVRTSEMMLQAKAAFAELIGVAAPTIGVGLNATSLATAFARNLAHVVRPGDRIVATASDHAANIVPWAWLERFGATLEIVPVDGRGDIDDVAFARALEREPILVALPWASNATGTIFDLARLSRLAKDAGAIVAVDGVQAAPHLRITMPASVDFAFFSAYKIFAPHLGFFYARPEVAERFFRSDDPTLPSAAINWAMETGTQSYEGWAGWLGTVAYLREIAAGALPAAMETLAVAERALTRHALAGFAERADRLTLYGGPVERERLPVFAFNVIGSAPVDTALALERAGIEARVGNYYSVRLMAALAPDVGGSAVRLSFAHYNTTGDVDRCFAALDALMLAGRHG